MNIADIFRSLAPGKKHATRRDTPAIDGGRRAGEHDNPYLAARRTWNDQVAANIASRQMFQLLAVLAMLIALAAVGGMAYIGSQSRFVPYVVEVDKARQPSAIGPAEKAAPTDWRIVRAAVGGWISDVRMVTPDIALQRKAIFRVYAMLAPNDAATAKTNEWLNGSPESNPFKRAEKETVDIELTSVIPQTADTWQVEWLETIRDRQGAIKAVRNSSGQGESNPQRWRALVTVYVAPPSPAATEDGVRNNPLGIHIRSFSWTKLL